MKCTCLHFVLDVTEEFVYMNSWNVQKKLWEKVDEQWNSRLRVASAENWLLLPSGVVKVSSHKAIWCD